jgi:hypothetical protein
VYIVPALTNPLHSPRTTYIYRYNAIDVSASIKVEVAAGQVVVGGSVHFLFMKKANTQVARVVYASTRRTKTATFTEDLLQKPQLQSRFLTNPRATHVVTRVTYGARTAVAFDTQVCMYVCMYVCM